MIHSYSFTSGLTKKTLHCEIEKKYGHKGKNKNEKVHCQNLLSECFPIEGS